MLFLRVVLSWKKCPDNVTGHMDVFLNIVPHCHPGLLEADDFRQ